MERKRMLAEKKINLVKNVLVCAAVVIGCMYCVFGKESSWYPRVYNHDTSELGIGVGTNSLERLLANIELVTLHQFNVPARLAVSVDSHKNIAAVGQASDDTALSRSLSRFTVNNGIDIRLIQISQLGQELHVPVPLAGPSCWDIYYSDVVSYQETGIYVSDPTEKDLVASHSVVDPHSRCSHDALVSIYRASRATPELLSGLSFIAGELTLTEARTIIGQKNYSDIELYDIAQRWFSQHHQG